MTDTLEMSASIDALNRALDLLDAVLDDAGLVVDDEYREKMEMAHEVKYEDGETPAVHSVPVSSLSALEQHFQERFARPLPADLRALYSRRNGIAACTAERGGVDFAEACWLSADAAVDVAWDVED